MRQDFSVQTTEEEGTVEITIRCTTKFVQMALDVARVQVEEVNPSQMQPPRLQEGPVAEPLQPRSPEFDAYVDAEWRDRGSGPVLPNMNGYRP